VAEAPAPRPAGALPPVVKALGAVSLCNDLASEMVYPLLPALLTRGLGAGALALGALDGIADAASAVVKVVAGRLGERRAAGGLPFCDLPAQDTSGLKECAGRLEGRFANLVVLGIGGSALGLIALNSALRTPHRWAEKPPQAATAKTNAGNEDDSATKGDTSDDVEETAAVDVWHPSDVDVMPRQKVNARSDRRRNMLAAWHLDSNSLVQLGASSTERVGPLPYQPLASGVGSSRGVPMVRRASFASAVRMPTSEAPSTETPPPPYAAAAASLRAAAALPTTSMLVAAWA